MKIQLMEQRFEDAAEIPGSAGLHHETGVSVVLVTEEEALSLANKFRRNCLEEKNADLRIK